MMINLMGEGIDTWQPKLQGGQVGDAVFNYPSRFIKLIITMLHAMDRMLVLGTIDEKGSNSPLVTVVNMVILRCEEHRFHLTVMWIDGLHSHVLPHLV
jgi:hypothetical protein